MKKIITIFTLLLWHFVNGQTSKLHLTINSSNSDDSTCYRVVITKISDTIHDAFLYTYIDKEFDNLAPGLYKIHLYKCSELSDLGMGRSITLISNKVTNALLDFSSTESYVDMDPKTRNAIVKDRLEVQFNLSHINPSWTESNSFLKFGSGLGLTSYYWSSFSKHFGVLVGLGLGVAHYGFSKDTTFINITSSKKTYEYYNYIEGHADLKFRVSFESQQDNNHLRPRTFFDIGAIYYAPISFRHIARYENNKKISNAGLHQFTDFRAHIDFGYSPVTLFAEFRLLDFIIGKYPELPKYNFGIKLTVH